MASQSSMLAVHYVSGGGRAGGCGMTGPLLRDTMRRCLSGECDEDARLQGRNALPRWTRTFGQSELTSDIATCQVSYWLTADAKYWNSFIFTCTSERASCQNE